MTGGGGALFVPENRKVQTEPGGSAAGRLPAIGERSFLEIGLDPKQPTLVTKKLQEGEGMRGGIRERNTAKSASETGNSENHTITGCTSTTNALAFSDERLFEPVYGPGSALLRCKMNWKKRAGTSNAILPSWRQLTAALSLWRIRTF